jgi:hypothetical protein
MRNLLISFLLSFSFITSYGQIEEVRRITKTLCSPEFNGRGYVNGGDSVAADFIVNEFKKIGLKPFKKDYLQHFSFGVNTFPKRMEASFESMKEI